MEFAINFTASIYRFDTKASVSTGTSERSPHTAHRMMTVFSSADRPTTSVR
jgi:hypothetical protein